MINSEFKSFLGSIVENLPSDWIRLTTHRLDIYNESLAKVEFIAELEQLKEVTKEGLESLPTAYDYIRLGHPLSSVLEWAIAKTNHLTPESVIAFSSQTMPLLALLRRNLFLKKKTRLISVDPLPECLNQSVLKEVYNYQFEVLDSADPKVKAPFEGSTVVVKNFNSSSTVKGDFTLNLYDRFGSIIEANDPEYIKEIQHVRRRESIAMTPQDSLKAIHLLLGSEAEEEMTSDPTALNKTIKEITVSATDAALGSCGLSVQYATMMGLIHHAKVNYPEKKISFIVPPNCYGGTNDQARRVAACLESVEIIDLPVDSGKNMVDELDRILKDCAQEDSVPYIIAEIPTNPRVEIPDLIKLQEVLKSSRKTKSSQEAVAPVFILDQTFCPNVKFFGPNGYLNESKVISYVSGSKFPSGGLCTAGYAVANELAKEYMPFVSDHLSLCDNQATDQQIQILTREMPSMNERIAAAYRNTRAFVDHIEKALPNAKINFVSQELADATFTPSVFSLDLPTKGDTAKEKEDYKRELNHRLIKMMIEGIPSESKHCVSYGQLKGCYWTVPATSTQGTTKESDKDYIVRVSVAADFNLQKHCDIFDQFVATL